VLIETEDRATTKTELTIRIALVGVAAVAALCGAPLVSVALSAAVMYF
jgi:hypothetical protein